MRFNKDFYLGGGGDYLTTFFVEVDNLFDRRNVLDVYSRTGQPDNDGQYSAASLATDAELAEQLDNLYDLNPQNYSSPRTIRVGLEMSF
jgi:putative lipoic acid-binding regulatory protein